MSAKDRINTTLARVTGHHLTRGEPGAERRRTEAEIGRLRRELAATERKLKAKSALPYDFDDEAKQIVTSVMPYTMTNPEKLFAFINSVRYIDRCSVPGAIVECGVWRGGSMFAAAKTLLSVGDHTRELYLFDTFEGMPPPTEADIRSDGKDAATLLETLDRSHRVWAIASLEDVQQGFETVPYPKERVHYVQGKVEDTVPDQVPDRIAILRLDTDWYESTAHELRHMYDRLSPGGVLMIDDYGDWAGSKKATDEFIERTGEPLLLMRMAAGRVAVKPWR